jgi:hypothetical protein
MKYKNWLCQWLDLYVKTTAKERTFRKYKKQVENHSILPAIKKAISKEKLTKRGLISLTDYYAEKRIILNAN